MDRFTLAKLSDLALIEKIPIMNLLPTSMQWGLVDLIPAFYSRPHFIQHMNDRGIPVVLLGVNTQKEMAVGKSLGVNVMLTDRCVRVQPAACLSILQ